MSERDDDLTGAYALDALSHDERAAFERRLETSESLRTEAGELVDTAAQLGLAVPAEAPPASLKADLMAQIAQLPQLPADEPVRSAATSPAELKAQTRWYRRPAVALAAAAAAAALVIGGGVVADIAARTGVQQEQADQLAALNAADDVQRVTTAVDGGGTATLVYSVELASSAVILDGVAALPDDRIYELWYIDESGPRPAGLMDVGTAASDDWRVLDGAFSAGDAVGVTVEPAGGSDQPTTDPIVVLSPA
jgi:anti-sigma-K factor RskA